MSPGRCQRVRPQPLLPASSALTSPRKEVTLPFPSGGNGDVLSLVSAAGGFSACQFLEGRACCQMPGSRAGDSPGGEAFTPTKPKFSPSTGEGSPSVSSFSFWHRLTHSISKSYCMLSVGQAPSCPWGPAKLNPPHRGPVHFPSAPFSNHYPTFRPE